MINFIAGIVIGLVLGVAIMAVMSAGQYNKCYSDAIDWAVNPQVKAVEYILNMI